MKTILMLLVIFSLPLMAATPNKTTRVEQVGPDTSDTSLNTQDMNTSPNPVPEKEDYNTDQSLIINGSDKQQREEAPAFEKGPYDKDGNYTLPKKQDQTEENP